MTYAYYLKPRKQLQKNVFSKNLSTESVFMVERWFSR